MFRTLSTGLGLVSLLFILPGCPLSPDDDEGPGDTRIPPRTSVSGAIAQYSYIWANKRFTEYQQLLHDNYEYFPQSTDLDDFPWLGGSPSWGRTDELTMAGNMFNEDFVSTETGESVDSITMELTVEEETQTQDGVQVLVHAVAQVLWTANDGLRSDVRFEFLVVPDPDEPGQFQIREQREQALF
jgi:hypothetical protein